MTGQSAGSLRAGWQRLGIALAIAIALGAFVLKAAADPATAATASPVALSQPSPEEAQQLALGAATFSRACTSCHQVGGVGLPGQFPPLKGNPNVADAAVYVEQTVRSGRQGPIVVNGVDYNGVMPTVGAALTDEEIAAVTAYVAADLTLPEGVSAITPPIPTMPGPPEVSLALIGLGFLVAGLVGAIVLGPLVLARNDQVELSWVDAGLKSAVVIGYFVVAGLLVPGRLMELDQISSLDRELQNLIGAGVWGGGMLIGLFALWWAGRKGLL